MASIDNQLFALLISTIEAAQPSVGIPNVSGKPGVPVVQNYQPTAEGVSSGPFAYITIISRRRYGSPGRKDLWIPPVDPDPGKETHTETQILETTFQIGALVPQTPPSSDITSPTALDIVTLLSAIMQSTATIAILQENDIGILRVTDIRNPKFLDDKERWEAAPSFDFTLAHKLIVTTEIDVLESEVLTIIPI